LSVRYSCSPAQLQVVDATNTSSARSAADASLLDQLAELSGKKARDQLNDSEAEKHFTDEDGLLRQTP
jgi:hypothetical protein